MRGHQLLSADVDIKELAVETKNFSGAELEGLVRAAQSTAMNRHIKVSPISPMPGPAGLGTQAQLSLLAGPPGAQAVLTSDGEGAWSGEVELAVHCRVFREAGRKVTVASDPAAL